MNQSRMAIANFSVPLFERRARLVLGDDRGAGLVSFAEQRGAAIRHHAAGFRGLHQHGGQERAQFLQVTPRTNWPL